MAKGRLTTTPNRSGIKESDVRKYGKYLLELEKKHGQIPDAKVLEKRARDPRNPLHGYLEWNTGRAALEWRRHQIRRLITYVKVYVHDASGKQFREKGWVSIQARPGEDWAGRQYICFQHLNESDVDRWRLEELAIKEFTALAEKYRRLKLVAGIRRAIAETVRRWRRH
jgi:hypothetical protein